MKSKNPLMGKVKFDEKGNLWVDNNIKFRKQIKSLTSAREWFYLMFDACEKENIPDSDGIRRFKESALGSKTTQWRTRKKLEAKGLI